MSILSWLIVGLVAGWLAGMVMKGSGFGVIGDMIVGILGALIGGFLSAVLLGADYVTGINLSTIVVAFIGSVILVGILRMVPGPHHHPPAEMYH